MRPIYENDSDRTAESKIGEAIEMAWCCSIKKLPISYRLDFALFRNLKMVGMAEIKVRKVQRSHYPTYFISSSKWMAGKQMSLHLKIPFLIVIGYHDGIFWFKASEVEPCKVEWGGRSDRGDSQDMEPMAHFETSIMKML